MIQLLSQILHIDGSDKIYTTPGVLSGVVESLKRISPLSSGNGFKKKQVKNLENVAIG